MWDQSNYFHKHFIVDVCFDPNQNHIHQQKLMKMTSFNPSLTIPTEKIESCLEKSDNIMSSNHYLVKAMQAKRALTLASLLKGENQDAVLFRLESKVKKLGLELVRVRRVARSNMRRPVSCLLLGETSFLPAQTVIEELEYMKTRELEMVSIFVELFIILSYFFCLIL